jgi:hypothetical protein
MDMLVCTPSPLPEKITEVAKAWEDREHTKVFVHVGTRNLWRDTVDWVWKQKTTVGQVETVDVILDSSGGSPDAAYQLVNTLRSIAPKLRVFVPDWAKSSATLFCLGADNIYMGHSAELGPLDTQLPDPRNPNEFISALEHFQAIDYIRTIAFLTLDEFRKLMVAQTRMLLADVISEAWQFSAELVAPLYSQVDPLLLGAAYRALAISIQYGRRLMSRYAYKDWSEKQITDLLEKLTWQYPSHQFVIDYKEATELNLKVSLLQGECEEGAHTIVNMMKDCVGFLGSETSCVEGSISKPITE